jgi:hypothetical protein
VDESRWTTADCRHSGSLSHVGNDHLDDNAGPEKVSGLSLSGVLKAVETTHAYDEQQREAATTGHTPSQVLTWSRHKEKEGGSEANTITHFLNSPSQT